MALTPGTHLGPYEVTAQIGVGGMGRCIGRRTRSWIAMWRSVPRDWSCLTDHVGSVKELLAA